MYNNVDGGRKHMKLFSFFDHTNVLPHPFEKRDMQSEEDNMFEYYRMTSTL